MTNNSPRPAGRTLLGWIAGFSGLMHVLWHGSALEQALACVGIAIVLGDIFGEIGSLLD